MDQGVESATLPIFSKYLVAYNKPLRQCNRV